MDESMLSLIVSVLLKHLYFGPPYLYTVYSTNRFRTSLELIRPPGHLFVFIVQQYEADI